MTWNGVSVEKTEKAIHVAVSDAGPLIHLDELGCLDILNYPEILLPDTFCKLPRNMVVRKAG